MSIEHCPRCSARVRVPTAAEPESWVRCPRCKMESQLSEMLAAEPPELELINGPSGVVPEYEPVLAGVGAAGDELSDFEVTASDTLVVDEDSPTLPLGGVSLKDNLFDDEPAGMGASIGRKAKSEDDELFGFDDDADATSLRSTSEDGKFISVPDDGDDLNLSDEPSADFGKASGSVAALGAGFGSIPTAPPKRKRKSNMFTTMLGVVGGGMFGILIAYYGILMWALGQDPFGVSKHFPEGMQMFLPAKLQKPVARRAPPVDTPDETPDNMPAEPGTTPAEPGTPMDNNPTEKPAENPADPLDPLAMPEKPKAPADPLDPLAGGNLPEPKANDPLDPLSAGGLPAPKPGSNDPGDPFGTNPAMPAKPEVAAPADPLDPLANTPPKPAPADPLDPLSPPTKPAADPLDPLANTPPTKPAPVDPLDPLAPKPEMPAKPEVAADPLAPKPADPLDPLAPKPEMPAKPEVASVDPLTPKPVDPLDPLAPKPADPLAVPAPAKASEPVMLASATYAPADLEQSLAAATASYETLAQKPDDKATQIASYRALSKLGEVAGQLKSLGDSPEKTAEHLTALQTTSKKLATDPSVVGVAKLTPMWLTVDPKNRNNGIVLQGTPGASEAAGKYQRTTIEVPGTPTKLTVVSEHPLLPNADGKVTVLGVIVDKPTEQIPGYPGPAERVIWVSIGEMEKPAAAAPAEPGAAPAPAPAPAKPGDDPFGE